MRIYNFLPEMPVSGCKNPDLYDLFNTPLLTAFIEVNGNFSNNIINKFKA